MGSLHNCLNEKRYHQFIYLVKLKSNVEELDHKLNTPLIKICSSIDNAQIATKLIKVLLTNGANIDVEDEEGLSPLHIVCKRNIPELVRILLSELPDCPVNITDMYGNTPLHYAASHEQTRIVSLLLPLLIRYRVNTDTRNKLGFTPLLIAASNGRLEVARYISCRVQVSRIVYDSLYFTSLDDWFLIYFDWEPSEDILSPATIAKRRNKDTINLKKNNLIPVATRPAVNRLLDSFSRESSAALNKRTLSAYTRYGSRVVIPKEELRHAPLIKGNHRPKSAPQKHIGTSTRRRDLRTVRTASGKLTSLSDNATGRKITLDVNNTAATGWVNSRQSILSHSGTVYPDLSQSKGNDKLKESYLGSMVELADICAQQLSESYRKTIVPTWPEPKPYEDPLIPAVPPKPVKEKQGSRAASIIMGMIGRGRRLGSESSASAMDEDLSTPKGGNIKNKLLKLRKAVIEKRTDDEDKSCEDLKDEERVEKAAAILSRVMLSRKKPQTKPHSLQTQSSIAGSTPPSP